MPNIVVLTRRYYPNMSPISAVIDKYLQRLKDEYQFHVVCIAGHSSLKKPDNSKIKVYYIKNKLWLLRLWSEEKYNATNNKLYLYLMQICRARAAFLNLFSDNLAYRWEYKAYYAEILKISNGIGIDGIISVSGDTVYTHLAAQKYKLSNPETKWVTFFTDPYSFQDMMYYPALFNKDNNKKKRYLTEKKIYENADYNITTEELFNCVINDFKQPRNKTICFKYVLDDIRNHVAHNLTIGTASELATLMYAGAFYKNIRNPQPMLEIMKRVNNVIFDLYVTSKECNDTLEKYKSERLHIFEGVPANVYKQKICYGYDILVNVGNDCDYQVPSKMLEYISTGNPIINFYYRKDSQYEMIEKYPLGLNVDVHNVSAYAIIIPFCEKMKGKKMAFVEIEKLFPENSLSKQTEVLKQLLIY